MKRLRKTLIGSLAFGILSLSMIDTEHLFNSFGSKVNNRHAQVELTMHP